MKSLLYIAAVVLGFMAIKNAVSTLAAFGFILVVILVLLYVRRAALLSRLATQTYYIKGNAEKASKLFEMAYKTGEMPQQCKISYSSFCLRENNIQKGKKLLSEVINSRFSTTDEKLGAKHNMAILLWREGNLEEAIETLEIVHKQAANTNTYGSLGVLYLEKAKENGEFESVLEFMLEAYDYNESDKTIADNLGELYYIMGEYEKAEKVYIELMKLNFFTPMPHYNYGRVLKALGKTDEAKEAFEKALDQRFTSVLTISREDVQKELESL